ncbi:6176_t:CDS:2, partial [Dentiscutata heterogama]
TSSDYITYPESISGTSYPLSPPQIIDVQTYDDGTILVSIAREISQDKQGTGNPVQSYNCTGQKLEQVLRLRLIQLDGSIKEINPQLNLDPINYCIFNDSYGNPVNPISIFPLYKPYILINYVKAPDLNNPKTYEEWGNVIDWNGRNISEVHYGPSYSYYPNGNSSITPIWSPRIDPHAISSNASYMITTIATITGDYAILNVNSTLAANNTLSLTTLAGLYMTIIPYNQSVSNDQVLLYQLTLPNLTFIGLYCDIAPSSIGYICIIEISLNITQSTYIKVKFLTSASVTKIDLLSDMPDLSTTGIISQGLGMQAMAFGGYILYAMNQKYDYYIWNYDEDNNKKGQLGPYATNRYAANALYNNINQNNLNAANGIMRNNNTFILASSTTLTSWSLYKIPLPTVIPDSGYGNLQVIKIDPPPINTTLTNSSGTINATTNSLTITFLNPVILSNGYISIYKDSDKTMRQKISASMKDYVRIINDNHTIVSIDIIGSTFNQYGETYYVQMDANFVRDEKLYEPLTGIDEDIVMYKSSNIFVKKARPSEEAAIYDARLTVVASKAFNNLAEANQTQYFKSLLQDIATKLPCRPELLSTYGSPRYSMQNIQFSIRVNKTNPKLDKNYTVPAIVSDIDDMIINKKVTRFSDGVTNDLDETFGFQRPNSILGDYKDKIIPFVSAAAANAVLYLASRSNKPVPDQYKQMLNTFTAGLFTASHTSLSSIFSFQDVNNYPVFSLSSKIFWITPLIINITVFTYIMCKGGFNGKKIMNLILIVLSLYNSETLLLINQNQLKEMFGKDFEATAKYRGFADILLKSIPQLITQEGEGKNEKGDKNKENEKNDEKKSNNNGEIIEIEA